MSTFGMEKNVNTKKNVRIMDITDVNFLISICHLEALNQAWNGKKVSSAVGNDFFLWLMPLSHRSEPPRPISPRNIFQVWRAHKLFS